MDKRFNTSSDFGRFGLLFAHVYCGLCPDPGPLGLKNAGEIEGQGP